MKKLRDYIPHLCQFMKITCVQFILAVVFAGLTMARNGMAQELLNRPISIQLENRDLKTALHRIEKAANVKFTYVPQLIAVANKVSVIAHNDRLEAVLDKLLKPLNINYQVSGTYIVLRKAPTSVLPQLPSAADVSKRVADITVAGTITDDKGVA